MNQKDFFELADEMEKECGDWEHAEGLSEAALRELIAKVEAMDEKEQRNARTFRMKKRYLIVLAAALVLLLGMGVAGDRAWISDSRDLERQSEITTKVDNEEKPDILREEEEIYQEIAENLGIAPMWLGYMPEGMVLDSYAVTESTGWAYINYLYNGKIVSVQMAKENAEVSGNVQWDGKYTRLEDITNDHGHEDFIVAYCIDEENDNYGANVSYGNAFYSISGFFEKTEFLEILKGIYFKSL